MQRFAIALVLFGVLLASNGCNGQPPVPNDIGTGGMVGAPLEQPASWQTSCQNREPDISFKLKFTWGWYNGLTDHPMIAVNDQFPGPLLVMQEGQCVSVTIDNQLQFNVDGTNVQYNSTVHFHGQHFHGAVWSDGVPGVTQCLVPFANTMTYYWTATAVGTSWYHGHYDGQFTSGLFGPYIVVPKLKSPYMADASSEFIMMLSDGYKNTYKTLINFVMSPLDYTGEEPLPDYLLMNGFMSNQLAFDAKKGTKVMIRLINSAALTMYRFWIDGIVMQVVEIDGSAVQPYTVSDVSIHVAQRITVILDLTANDVTKLNSVLMHFDNTLMATERIPYEYVAVLSFTGTPQSQYFRGRTWVPSDNPTSTPAALPTTFLGADVIQTSTGDWNMLDAKMLYPIAAPEPTLTINTDIVFQISSDGIFYAYFSGITYNQLKHHMQYPSLYELQDNVASGQLELPTSFFNPNISGGMVLPGQNSFHYVIPPGAVVDVIINNTDGGSHPIHFHGYRFWMIDSDQNVNASTHDSYLMRDVATAAPLGWTRFRFVANNPGTWLLHCHIDWHFEEGLATIVTVDPLSFMDNPNPAPAEHMQTCAYWQSAEVDAFNAAAVANAYTPSTVTIVTAADAAPWVFIANTIICIESIFALAIYKAGIMYSILFDLVALNVGTLLGVCWIELEHAMWLKVANGVLQYEIVSFLILIGFGLPYVFEKFVKRGRANKFAWLKQAGSGGGMPTVSKKGDPSSVGSASDQAPSVAKPAVSAQAQTPRAAALSVDDDEQNLIRIHANSAPESPKKAKKVSGSWENQERKAAGETADAKADVELVAANASAIASPSAAAAKAVQMPEDPTKGGDIREADGVTIDHTKHGEYKLAKAAAQEMDVVLIIIMLGGDMLHNFVDGCIIASAFLTSNAIGLATSIGIFMEELPHLIGTFAVFVHAGAPIWKAVALSTFGAFPFILGGALIIGVASDTNVNRDQISYLLAFAIGSFLYITLADLVPVLTSQWAGPKRAIIQTFCVLAGIGLQASIAVYNYREGEDAHPFTTASGGTFDPT